MNLYLSTCLLAITLSHAIFLLGSTDWVEFAKVVTPTVATIVVGVLAYLEARAAKREATDAKTEARSSKEEAQASAKTITEKVDANTKLTENTGVVVNGRMEQMLAEARAAAFAEGKLQGLAEARSSVVVINQEKQE